MVIMAIQTDCNKEKHVHRKDLVTIEPRVEETFSERVAHMKEHMFHSLAQLHQKADKAGEVWRTRSSPSLVMVDWLIEMAISNVAKQAIAIQMGVANKDINYLMHQKKKANKQEAQRVEGDESAALS